MAWKPDESPTSCPPHSGKGKNSLVLRWIETDRKREGGRTEGGKKPPLVTVKEALGEEK